MTAPSAAMRAAEEIAAYSDSVYGPKDGPSFGRELQLETIAAIIAKHAPPADAAVAQMRAQRMREGAPDFGLILTESTVDILYGKWKEGRELSRDELDALFRTALALHWDDDMRECERNELRAALAAGPADAWRPIESAPKDGTAVWLWHNGGSYIGYCDPADRPWKKKDTWLLKAKVRPRSEPNLPDNIVGTHVIIDEPTHWQPLPEPPR